MEFIFVAYDSDLALRRLENLWAPATIRNLL
jgi:hypothetical protein